MRGNAAQIIKETAAKHGFARVYLLKLQELDEWRKYSALYGTDANMPYSLSAAYPGATAAAMLVWAYSPFAAEHISPYYAASNSAYHAAAAVERELNTAGCNVQRAFIPVRALCIANGLGVQGKNALLSISPFGTRIALEAMMVYTPVEPDIIPQEGCTCPPGCTICINACPMGAICKGGLNVRRCMRYIMQSGYTEEIWAKQQTFLGCEICQAVCPRNAHLAAVPPPAELAEAFELERLITGNAKAARALVGKNITGNGRLTMEAIAFAAREGRCAQQISACLNSPFEQVRRAAKWALAHYFGQA